MKEQTKDCDDCVFGYGMNRLEARIEKNLAGVGYDL